LQEGKIFFIAHHLVIDIVSWNSIFNDLTHALDRISARKEFSFKPQTASLSSWGERLQELARSQELLQELPYWNTQRAMGKYFPSDFKYSRQIYLNRDIARYQQKLDPAATKLLLQQANKTYTTKTEDLLLTALLMGIGKWSKTNKVLIGLERHGRSPGITSLDISNTVGWFTSFFPVLLGFDHHLPLGNKIKTIKEQLRAVPNDGIGYGTLKYLSNDNTISESLDQVPELIYNYMGILGNNAEHTDLGFRFIQGISQDPRSERSYSIEINSYISDGSLVVNWSYSSLVFRESTIITLAAEIEKYLKDLIDHSVSKNEIEYTPSDFPEADLSQNDLDKLMRSLNE
jgi:non-ribosomal peptide synthase protein (TIGR01720 family)